jgi:hypothetical protein
MGSCFFSARPLIRDTARRFAANVLPVVREIQVAGTKSNAAIAAKLNERRVPTAPGGVWTHVQVRAVILLVDRVDGVRRNGREAEDSRLHN